MTSKLVSQRIVTAAFGMVLAAGIFAGAQQQQPPVQLAGKTSEQAYQNIQVLKGIPAEQVLPAMRVIAGSLGVACQFCHVQGDFVKDDKETKKTARLMIAMMMGINKNTFNGKQEVTCYTCHNGSNAPANTLAFPEVTAAMMAPAPAPTAQAAAPAGGRGAPAAAAPQGPSANQILASYVQALGGEQAIRKITSRSITGTRDAPAGGGGRGGAQTQTVEEYHKAPNLTAAIAHAANGATTATGFDGTTAWAQDARGAVTDLTGSDQTSAARAADFYEPLNLMQEYASLTAAGTAKVGDHEAYVVIGTPQGDQPERLFFDTKTGLLLRKITVVPTPLGNLPTQMDYDDYRDTGSGVKFPFMTSVTNAPNARVTTRIQKVQDNAPIDGSKLAKPASKAAEAPAR